MRKKGHFTIYAVTSVGNKLPLTLKGKEDCIKPVELEWQVWLENERKDLDKDTQKKIYFEIYSFIKSIYHEKSIRELMRQDYSPFAVLKDLIEQHDINLVGETRLDGNSIYLTLTFKTNGKPISNSRVHEEAYKVIESMYHLSIYMFLKHLMKNNNGIEKEFTKRLSNFTINGKVYNVRVKKLNYDAYDTFLQWDLFRDLLARAEKEMARDMRELVGLPSELKEAPGEECDDDKREYDDCEFEPAY